MMNNIDDAEDLGDLEDSAHFTLKIAEGQHWIEDDTGIRYVVVADPSDIHQIKIDAVQDRRASKTVSLAELLAGFVQSSGTCPS